MATTKTTKVMGGKKNLGNVEYQIFDTSAEAVSSLGEEEVVRLVNVQNKTSTMNRYRQQFQIGPPTKERINQVALQRLSGNADLLQEFAALGGDVARPEAFMNTLREQVKTELEAAAKSRADAAAVASDAAEEGGTEEEDDDDE